MDLQKSREFALMHLRHTLEIKSNTDRLIEIHSQSRKGKLRSAQTPRIIHAGFLPTSDIGDDNWLPNWVNDRVFVYAFKADHWMAVRISGNDDFSMVRQCQSESEIQEVINSLPNPISKKWCSEHGFRCD